MSIKLSTLNLKSGEIMRRLLIVAVVLVLFVPRISASDLDYGIEYRSRYIWRGLDYYKNNRAALQAYVKYNFADGFGVKLFGSFALQDRGELKNLEEIDVILSYSRRIGDVVLSAGFSNYGFYFREKFDFDRDNSQEFNVGATFLSLPLKPAITVYWHAGFKRWFYIDMVLSHTVYEGENSSLALIGDIGYDGKQNMDKAGFTNAGITLKSTFKVGRRVRVSPYIKYIRIFKREINPSDNEFVFGLKFDV